MIELENTTSGFDETFFVASFEKAGGIWIDVSQTGYPTYDGSHLNPEGALEFSHDLAQLMILAAGND